MHKSSYQRMNRFIEVYLDPDQETTILDLGSMDVNGSYRNLFNNPKWTYIGVDLDPGENVDCVIKDPYRWEEIADESIDVVVSGQAFEHVEFFWLSFQELARKLKPGGLTCLIVPSRGFEHRYPVDCWRFYPDGMKALAAWAGLELVEAHTQWDREGWDDDSDEWGDTVGLFHKPLKAKAFPRLDSRGHPFSPGPKPARQCSTTRDASQFGEQLGRVDPQPFPFVFSWPERLTEISSWHRHIPFGMSLVKALRPRLVVEIGTHKGDSYCALCQAVQEIGLDCRCCAVDTWLGDRHAGTYEPEDILTELRSHHDPRYGHFSTLIQASFDQAVDSFAPSSIDLLHIDGLHTFEAVSHDFQTWLPKVSDRGVVLLHDTRVFERDFGVWRFWEEVSPRYPSFEFPFGHGLGVIQVGSRVPDGVRRLFQAQEPDRTAIVRQFEALGQCLDGPPPPESRDELDQLRDQVRELDKDVHALTEELAHREQEAKSWKAACAARQEELAKIESSLGWKLVKAWRRGLDRCCPAGTLRARAYARVKHAALWAAPGRRGQK